MCRDDSHIKIPCGGSQQLNVDLNRRRKLQTFALLACESAEVISTPKENSKLLHCWLARVQQRYKQPAFALMRGRERIGCPLLVFAKDFYGLIIKWFWQTRIWSQASYVFFHDGMDPIYGLRGCSFWKSGTGGLWLMWRGQTFWWLSTIVFLRWFELTISFKRKYLKNFNGIFLVFLDCKKSPCNIEVWQ